MKRSKKAAIGAGSALAAVALAFVMLGVGNVPSYQPPPGGCAAGQSCSPGLVTTPTIDAGVVIVATGNNLCLDGPTCSVAIMNNTGQMVFSAPVAGGRFPGSLTAQGTTTLGSAFADYITIAGASAGNGTTITAVSSGSNSPINLVPKGTGAVAVTGPITATGTVTGSQLLVSSLKAPVVHGTGTVQQAIEPGTGTLNGGGALVVTFSTAFGAAPVCIGTSSAGTGNAIGHDGTSTTAVTFRGTAAETFDYICIGHL